MIDIGGEDVYPASELSNFQERDFIFEEVVCKSMEGVLQSFKFKDPEKQKQICGFVGKKAKFAGKKRKWYLEQTLYWKGEAYDRHSSKYQELLDRAFEALSKNKDFCQALLDTKTESLRHTIGKKDPYRTILTEEEFCTRLEKIREKIQNGC